MNKSKKYSRVSEHYRLIRNGVPILVHAHIRKNPRFKEIKMNEDEKTEGTTEVIDHGLAKKERPPRSVNFNVKLADGHYIVSFDHGPPRVFHNVQELLVAIEVEVKRLGGTLGGG